MADDAIAHTPGSYGGAMGDGTRAPRWWYVAMGVVAAGALGMAVLLVVVELEWDSAFLVAVAVWPLLVLLIAWMVLAVVGLVRHRVWRLSTVPVILAMITVALLGAAVPSRIAFATSRGELESVARECESRFDDRWIGLVRVSSSTPIAGGCLLYTPGGGIDPVGWAYSPGGAPILDGVTFTHHSGDWYRFRMRF
ncbi:hypothetical protein Gbro_1191 [Gordonia bronchialis DSM 43247]|uniref:DUF1109 domain-containing protein n=1 Tax=Gordonia bronchialis (strain ATCC 25592 / DSM 43247 / BCRC 13721 / JCM 3198 / KCTC 3076 / NBRC 16047 / NCTC 10667) TaxID=526226 RepID=D0L543_GORB4|nr:hypothetical protein [Gordonia bronchialis]ACY20495.1 hypothetical protein Gbro_1191 [Gordonia bronchialis DSM 43247]MCC3323262.1 hypothetical protein [Gordonia bronchialis]QGS25725.1 hypothetical protein FOB84_17895 [Gordonia bronchialis]UAK37860.1 hypothetical protein K8O93_22850 [Gordonia bronchialis]STQ63302.1 Uncharacterised protein [Gordonia bronchialis]